MPADHEKPVYKTNAEKTKEADWKGTVRSNPANSDHSKVKTKKQEKREKRNQPR